MTKKQQDDPVKVAEEIFNSIPKISYADYVQRKREWSDYYLKVKSGTSYQRLMAQREAMSIGDLKTVKSLANKAVQDLTDGNHEFVMPSLPDPDIEIRQKRLVIAN